MRTENFNVSRLVAITLGLLAILGVAQLLKLPLERPFAAIVFGSPITFTLSIDVLALFLLIPLFISGAELVWRSDPAVRERSVKRRVLLWVTPALAALAFTLWLRRFETPWQWLLLALAGGILIPSILIGEGKWSKGLPTRSWQRLVLGLQHGLAYALFYLIAAAHLRSLLSGSAVFLITLLLTARIVWPYRGRDVAQSLTFGSWIGLIMGEIVWALNYIPLRPWEWALAISTLFFISSSLLWEGFKNGRLTQLTLLRYALFGFFLFMVILLL